MKVCLIGNNYVQQFPLLNYGGIEICVETSAYILHELNLDFIVITPKRKVVKNFPFDKNIRESDISPVTEGGDYIQFAIDCVKFIKEFKPDVIWSQSYWSADVLSSLGIPIICTFHDSCYKQEGWMRPYPNVKYRFISKFQYNNWVKEDWEKESSFQCYSGLSERDYFFDDKIKRNYFLWVAGLQWGITNKGLDIFVELAERNPNFNFIAYGPPHPLTSSFIENAQKRVNNFKFLGCLERGEKHTKVFSEAIAFIIPSQIPDTFPRTVLEALSKGTPVIGSANGSLPETIKTMGFYSNNIEELNSALKLNFNNKTIFDYSKNFSGEIELDILLNESKKIIEAIK